VLIWLRWHSFTHIVVSLGAPCLLRLSLWLLRLAYVVATTISLILLAQAHIVIRLLRPRLRHLCLRRRLPRHDIATSVQLVHTLRHLCLRLRLLLRHVIAVAVLLVLLSNEAVTTILLAQGAALVTTVAVVLILLLVEL
jgi:hypothetical protein